MYEGGKIAVREQINMAFLKGEGKSVFELEERFKKELGETTA